MGLEIIILLVTTLVFLGGSLLIFSTRDTRLPKTKSAKERAGLHA